MPVRSKRGQYCVLRVGHRRTTLDRRTQCCWGPALAREMRSPRPRANPSQRCLAVGGSLPRRLLARRNFRFIVNPLRHWRNYAEWCIPFVLYRDAAKVQFVSSGGNRASFCKAACRWRIKRNIACKSGTVCRPADASQDSGIAFS